jgi:hypothetical protein
VKANFKIRGNTSIADCPFPKLELNIDDVKELKKAQSIIPGLNARIKIGTRCGVPTDDLKESAMGRSFAYEAPHTEAFIYRLASELGLVTSAAAPARIHYVDTELKKSYVESAFLFEYPKDAVARHNMKIVKAPESAAESHESDFDWENLKKSDVIKIYLFQALILNSDFSYPFLINEEKLWEGIGSVSSGSPLWNMKVTQDKNAKRNLYVNDFDLAMAVTGGSITGDAAYFSDIKRFNEALAKPGLEKAFFMWEKLQSYRSLFGDQELKKALVQFEKDTAKLLTFIKSMPEDFKISKATLISHVDQISIAIKHFDSKMKLYFGVSNWYQDINSIEDSSCLVKGGAPQGMPVLLTDEKKNGYQKVYYLDVFNKMFDLDTFVPCTNPGWVKIEDAKFQ